MQRGRHRRPPTTAEVWARLGAALGFGVFIAAVEWLILRAAGIEHLSGWKGYASLSILAICFGDVAAAYADDRRASTLSSVGIFGLAHILALFVVVERNLVESGQLDFMTFWKDADNGFLWITGTAVALGFAFRAGDLGPRLAEWLLRRRSLGG